MRVVLIAVLLLRVALSLGPERFIFCVHGDGEVAVEAGNDVCCRCTDEEGDAAAPSLTEGDGCRDYPFTTQDPPSDGSASAKAPVVNELALEQPALLLVVEQTRETCPGRASHPKDTTLTGTVILRC